MSSMSMCVCLYGCYMSVCVLLLMSAWVRMPIQRVLMHV